MLNICTHVWAVLFTPVDGDVSGATSCFSDVPSATSGYVARIMICIVLCYGYL